MTETLHHAPKTRSSYRTIPIPFEVLQSLAQWMESQKVIHSDGRLFGTRKGGPWTVGALSHRWGKKSPRGILVKAAEALDMPRLAQVPIHRLRSTFISMASRLGTQESLLMAYVGHAPKSVMGLHYRKITLEELGTIAAIMEGWKTLEDGQSVWKHSGLLEQRNAVSD